jgi:hypothetical protein
MFWFSWSMMRLRFGIALVVLGGMLAYFGYREFSLASTASAAPQDLTLEQLAARGPGGNPNVRLHDFTLGKDFIPYCEDGGSRWSAVYIPALPQSTDRKVGVPAKVIVLTNSVRNEDQLEGFRARATIQGLVSNDVIDLDPEDKEELAASYPGTDFNKCVIVHEGRQPTEGTTVLLMLGGGVGLALVGVMLLGSFFLRST